MMIFRCLLILPLIFLEVSSIFGQINLGFQGGEPGDNWSYSSTGADATALSQAFLAQNIVSGSFAMIVGGNTPGGSCIDGGSGNGPNTPRTFTFDNLDISSSNQFTRTLTFSWGNRHPVCLGTGYDVGENVVFTPFHDGTAQTANTIATGGGDAAYNIQQNVFNYNIPSCVNSFYFTLSVTTNRRDELLLLDDVELNTPALNGSGGGNTSLSLNVCSNQLPYNWNGLIFTQAGQQQQTFTNAFGCDSVVTYNLNTTIPVTTTFANTGPFCSGAVIPALTTTSQNGITGTWSPAINNASTTTYTFTPSVGQCGTSTTLTLVINSNVTPTFANLLPYCVGSTIPALPSTSQNGIIGTWTPAINNVVTTAYTFTPNAGQCGTSTTITVVVTPNIPTTFTAVGPFCSGDDIPALPTTSQNGISGTWSPAINNTATATYTFTPSIGQCGTTATMIVLVNPNIIPIFSGIAPYCSGEAIQELPTTSQNGIIGTWSPAINNTTTNTYTFTPISNDCVSDVEQTIVINQPSLSAENLNLCDSQIPFSWNGINISQSGNYSIILNNQFGCDSTINLTINIAPTIVQNLSVQVCISDLPYQFFNQSINNPGIYQYTTNNQDICDTTFVLNLSIISVPNFSISNSPLSSCQSPLDVIYTMQGGQNVLQCAWQTTGQTGINCDGFLAQYNFPGCHDVTLTVTDVNGCIQTLTEENITCILQSPNAQFVINPNNAETGEEVTLNNYSTNAFNYFWEFGNNSGSSGISDPTVSYQSQGEFVITLIAINELGCTDTTSQVILVKEPVLFYVPNAFTPDGKMFNEVFTPVMTAGFDLYQYRLVIFNRWGEIVFESLHPKKGWDGLYANGQPTPDGTYVWQIEFQNKERINEVHRGHLTLIR